MGNYKLLRSSSRVTDIITSVFEVTLLSKQSDIEELFVRVTYRWRKFFTDHGSTYVYEDVSKHSAKSRK